MGIQTNPSVVLPIPSVIKVMPNTLGDGVKLAPSIQVPTLFSNGGSPKETNGYTNESICSTTFPQCDQSYPKHFGDWHQVSPSILVHNLFKNEGVQTKQMGIRTNQSVVLPIPSVIKVTPNTLGAGIKLAPRIQVPYLFGNGRSPNKTNGYPGIKLAHSISALLWHKALTAKSKF